MIGDHWALMGYEETLIKQSHAKKLIQKTLKNSQQITCVKVSFLTKAARSSPFEDRD